MKSSLLISLLLAIISGIGIAYIDTRPHWDDTGISILMILIASFVCGCISSQKIWLIALAVGVWIPVFNIVLNHNYESLVVLAPAFIGAYAGYFSRKIFTET
jgi:hypothetical protein